MASQAQIEANRRNAQKSTGPRTDAGKAAVRGNAVRHGFCSEWALMSEENPEEAASLIAQLREENQPVGFNEDALVYKMAVNLWNFFRAGMALADALEAAENDDQSVPTFSLALRYQTTCDRLFNQNLRELRKLQKERKLQENGFVSQNLRQAPAEEPQKPANPPAGAVRTAPPAVQPPIPVTPTAETPVVRPEKREMEFEKPLPKAA